MKTLYLIRHAKSSWDDASLDDFDRPLNQRGKRDAPDIGNRLKKMGIIPDKMISSSAKRAADTAILFARAMQLPAAQINFLDELYHASASQLLHQVSLTDQTVRTLFVFGHNPGLTDFANIICKTPVANIVTAAVFAVQLDIKQWSELKPDRQGELYFYDFPKSKKKQ